MNKKMMKAVHNRGRSNPLPKPIIFAAGRDFLALDGLTETILPREDGLRIQTDPGTFEWWYFDAHFEDGSTAVIVYATKSFINPHTQLMPNLSLTITRPDGRKTAEFDLPPASEFSAAKEICDVRIGLACVRQERKDSQWCYTLHAQTDTQSADLIFTGLVLPWRPGAGKSYFGDLEHFFAWLPAIPYGTVEGTLTYDGRTRRVRGTGYHDHNWGNISLPSVLDHWIWGRAHVGDYSLIFVEQIAARKFGFQRIPVFLLVKGDKILADDARLMTMQAGKLVQHQGGRKYPLNVDFLWTSDNKSVHLALRDPQLIEATSLLGALPPFQRRFARLVANPYYFRFNARLELSIDLEGLRDTQHGTALYELMLLR
jgi:hypothetical protein